MTATAISVNSLKKAFREEVVLQDIDLTIEEGEFCIIVGPSGCGKSTLLNCLAGLVEYDTGHITINGMDGEQVPVDERDLGYVFQEFEETLFPHKTVAQNIAFGLHQQDGEVSEAEIDERIDEMLSLLAISETKHDHPSDLSGGQQQRVELARQLVRECDIMLLDDPLADLDYKLQKRMELEMRHIHETLDSTFVYVTHNQDQALKLADKLVVMNQGMIEQIGTPRDVYENPETAFVGRFVGDSNVLLAENASESGDGYVEVETGIGPVTATPQNGVGERDGGIVFVRPESVSIGGSDSDTVVSGVLEGQTYTGESTEFIFSIDGMEEDFYVVVPGRPTIGELGETIDLGIDASDVLYFENLSVTGTVTRDDLMEV